MAHHDIEHVLKNFEDSFINLYPPDEQRTINWLHDNPEKKEYYEALVKRVGDRNNG